MVSKINNPEVSVILPTYNRDWCLERSVESVLNQSFKEFELIVVDDGSTDSTQEKLKAYSGVTILSFKTNSGVSASRNLGLEKAQGKYVCFLDSDDSWKSNKLEKQWQFMENHLNAQACYTDEIWIRRGKRVNPKKKHQKYSGDIFRHSLPLCIISPSSVMLRASVFKEIGFFDEDMLVCEDYDFWLRLTARYHVKFLETPLIFKYGGHADQLSQKFWGMDRFRVYSLEKLLREKTLSEEKRKWVLEMLIEKCSILETGFRNRGKLEDSEMYGEAIKCYVKLLNSNLNSWDEISLFNKEMLLPFN